MMEDTTDVVVLHCIGLAPPPHRRFCRQEESWWRILLGVVVHCIGLPLPLTGGAFSQRPSVEAVSVQAAAASRAQHVSSRRTNKNTEIGGLGRDCRVGQSSGYFANPNSVSSVRQNKIFNHQQKYIWKLKTKDECGEQI